AHWLRQIRRPPQDGGDLRLAGSCVPEAYRRGRQGHGPGEIMNDIVRHARVRQPLLFLRLRGRLLRNSLATVLGTAPARLLTILVCSAIVGVGVYAGSAYGF